MSNVLIQTIEWAKSKLNFYDFSVQEFEPAFAFLLTWSLFEGRLFKDEDKNRLSLLKLVNLAKFLEYTVDKDYVCEVYGVFSSRYFGSERIHGAFKNLHFEDGVKDFFGSRITCEEFVKNTMKSPVASFSEKFAALLLVCYRFRNNLYHGIKRIDKIREYQKCYSELGGLLRMIVDVCPVNWFESLQA